MLPSLRPEHQEALMRNEKLQKEFILLDEECKFLLHHQGPLLEGIYLRCVGKYKLELMGLKAETFRLKRTFELMQACVNRNEKVNLSVIKVLVEVEIENELKKIHEAAQKLSEAFNMVATPVLSDEQSKEFKKIYYRLAKKLHPDLNPEQDAETKSVWNRVMEAYKTGDIEKLRLLDDILFPSQDETHDSSLLEILQQKNVRLAAGVRSLIHQIDNIKNSFPIQFKEYLDDEQWVIEQNNQSLNDISDLRDEKRSWEQMIEHLLISLDESGNN